MSTDFFKFPRDYVPNVDIFSNVAIKAICVMFKINQLLIQDVSGVTQKKEVKAILFIRLRPIMN